MTRARTNIVDTERGVAQALLAIRAALESQLEDGNEVDMALCTVETFCAVAAHVMKHSNPSKVREAAQIVEIRARMDGVPVVDRRAA